MVAFIIILLTVFCFLVCFLGWVALNVPTGPSDCIGIMGKIFGHNYEAIYDSKQSAAKNPPSIRSDNLEHILQKYRDVENTYIGHVCKQCGRKVLKSELGKE